MTVANGVLKGLSPTDTSARHLVPITPGSEPANKGRRGRGRDKRKTEASNLAMNIVSSPEYLKNLRKRANAGIIAPAIEVMLWYYAYGKPVERSEIFVTDDAQDYSDMSTAELAQRASQLAQVALLLVEESKKKEGEN